MRPKAYPAFGFLPKETRHSENGGCAQLTDQTTMLFFGVQVPPVFAILPSADIEWVSAVE